MVLLFIRCKMSCTFNLFKINSCLQTCNTRLYEVTFLVNVFKLLQYFNSSICLKLIWVTPLIFFFVIIPIWSLYQRNDISRKMPTIPIPQLVRLKISPVASKCIVEMSMPFCRCLLRCDLTQNVSCLELIAQVSNRFEILHSVSWH